MKIEQQESIPAWRVETEGDVFLRLVNEKFERPDIWYRGIADGFELVSDAHSDQLEALFENMKKEIQDGK